jgi:hypothetical protein
VKTREKKTEGKRHDEGMHKKENESKNNDDNLNHYVLCRIEAFRLIRFDLFNRYSTKIKRILRSKDLSAHK